MQTLTPDTFTPASLADQPSPIVVDTKELRMLRANVLFHLFKTARRQTGSIWQAYQLLKALQRKYKKVFSSAMLSKAVKVDGRYFWRLGTPGFPSPSMTRFYQNEFNRLLPERLDHGLTTLFIAITNKCPLNCEHCFEWDNLGQSDQLSRSEIIDIIHRYQDYGTTQIMLSGGEPMHRVQDIYQILAAAKPGSDFWIITSGWGFTSEKAQKLKEAGLTGVMVSLDHHEPVGHNHFRGNNKSFNWVMKAIANANKAGLVTTLALCATKTYTTHENLTNYLELAKKLGVSFVQLIEPRATGRYAGKNILLNQQQIQILEDIFLTYNSQPQFKDYPIINYLGILQRRLGCFGAGDRFFYIDANGNAHICPFCRGKVVKAAEYNPAEMRIRLSQEGCHAF